MSILWTYGAGLAAILLAFFSLAEDFYLKKGVGRRVSMSAGLLIATVITLISIHGSDKQHSEDEGKVTELQAQVRQLGGFVQAATETQVFTTKQLSNARALDTKQFLGEFDKLSTRVTSLQTQVATTDLREEAAKLQADLQSTRKAMRPERATLTFSMDPGSDQPVHTTALAQTDNKVHLKISVRNSTDADALDGDVVFMICDQCKYATEPSGAVHINGSPETQRNISFHQSLAHSGMPLIEFDVEAPSFPFQAAIFTMCHTCMPVDLSKRGYDSLLSTVYATNPQASSTKIFPKVTIRPLLK